MQKFAIRTLAGALMLGGLCSAAQAASTIQFVYRDDPALKKGFFDETPVVPVGGNPGTTLGEQRRYVFDFVKQHWESVLNSSVPIVVSAGWEALTCTATSATLGSAGARGHWRDFKDANGNPIPGLKPGTWYPRALANKLAGYNLAKANYPDRTDDLNADIKTQFNVNLGADTCLEGKPFYLGVDGNAPATTINLMGTLLHELGHGLGFASGTYGLTGARIGQAVDGSGKPIPNSGQPRVWDAYMVDIVTGKTWLEMTDAERVTSAVNGRRLVWNGEEVKAKLPQVLSLGTPSAKVSAPSRIARNLPVGLASYGPALSAPGVTGEVMPVVDQADGTGTACTALSASNKAAVAGKIALIDRGTCSFATKTKNAQDAGALGVMIVDTAMDNPPPGLAGDPLVTTPITIPTVRIAKLDGDALKEVLKGRSRTRSGLFVTLGVDLSQYAGADSQGRLYLYTPNPYAAGSSVSHYDTSATRNLLMEPFDTPGLTTFLVAPYDLTYHLLRDIGW